MCTKICLQSVAIKKGSETFWHTHTPNIEQALRKIFSLNKSCRDGECLVYTWIFYAIKYCIQGLAVLPGHAHISKWLKRL